MRIRTKRGEGVFEFEASDEAAAELIARGDYEAVPDNGSQSAEAPAVPPGSARGEGSPAAVPSKRRRRAR